MDKVLIIGPFGDYGGREIDTSFIASSLSEEFDVSICSTVNFSLNSQIYSSFPNAKVTSLKKQLFKNHFLLKPATFLSFIKNRRIEPIYFYVNNKINSNFFLKQKELKELKSLIKKSNIIFIRAHLFTLRTKEIIELASEFNKKIIFRTTGAIERRNSWPDYLNKVNLFIHHSESNARNLHNNLSVNYKVIDQTATQEEKLLEVPYLKRPIRNFVVMGRFSPEKNILNLISYFKKCSSENDILFIVGDGEGRSEIEKELTGFHNIKILGQLSTFEIAELYDKIDCLIISSLSEAGPLVGIEAMAAAKIILSTEVGAMVERLKGSVNDFWFQPEDMVSFKKQFQRITNLTPSEVHRIAKKNRNLYIQNHSTKEVSDKYRNLVSQLLHISS